MAANKLATYVQHQYQLPSHYLKITSLMIRSPKKCLERNSKLMQRLAQIIIPIVNHMQIYVATQILLNIAKKCVTVVQDKYQLPRQDLQITPLLIITQRVQDLF